MMRMLTGQQQSDESFQFEPSSVTAIGDCTVVAEGRNASLVWVHAWTVADGVITQVREYFNTSLTVTRFAAPSSSSTSSSSKRSAHCLPLWQSSSPRGTAKSMPALVLAI
ncbi:wound-induced protein 1 [Nymphaea colorata]|uniref:wound-induced protein 1 n=1 Tax=Nymphaea colorata TaxID=210225 RepID=UPI00129E7CDE|nr:wound-induced protein 1 [Nymphaea colorata]